MKFSNIFSLGSPLLPVEQQIFRGKVFEQEVASISKNKMSLWKFDEEFSQPEIRYLLGVCPSWNRYDLYLLDCINDHLATKTANEVLEVFDLDSPENLENLPKIFGNNKPTQPPVLGIWEEGVLIKCLWHWNAINFLMEKYEFEWQPPKVNYDYQ